MKKMMLAVFMAITLTTALHARERQLFDHNCCFMLADSTQMSQPGYHDGAWRRLDLPHDWAIEGDFRADNPQCQRRPQCRAA
jgi:beta-galactosidase